MAKNKHPTAKPSKKSHKTTQAERADRHILYQKSVQDTGFEFEFVDATFKRLRGRRARRLREDFCGTAAMCCEWVRRRRDNEAVGVDLDPGVLAWGREHNLGTLTSAEQRRVRLVEGDVLTAELEPAELLLAMNFSYQCFKDRATLRRYFESAHRGLTDDGC
jgi:SAM-dependent methyltransferase